MPLGNYLYVADSGYVYQLSIPIDFATALGLTPASGLEQYLDAPIQPRYANYRSTSGLVRSSVIGTRTSFGALPPLLTVGFQTYQLIGAIGEQTSPYVSALTVSPIGIIGPPGPPGAAGLPGTPTYIGNWDSATTYNFGDAVSSGGSSWVCILSNTNEAPPNATYWNPLALAGASALPHVSLVNPAPITLGVGDRNICGGGTLVPAGTYLMSAVVQWYNPLALSTILQLQIIMSGLGYADLAEVDVTGQAAGKVALNGIIVLPGNYYPYIDAKTTMAGLVIADQVPLSSGNPPCTQLSLVKIA